MSEIEKALDEVFRLEKIQGDALKRLNHAKEAYDAAESNVRYAWERHRRLIDSMRQAHCLGDIFCKHGTLIQRRFADGRTHTQCCVKCTLDSADDPR